MRFIAASLILLVLAGCDDSWTGVNVCGPTIEVARTKETPVVNPPLQLRQSNWIGRREGSCVFATSCTLLKWQGRFHTADRIRASYSDGINAYNFARVLDAEGVRYVYSDGADLEFIDRCCATRRGCLAVVSVARKGDHVVAVVHSTPSRIGILDPNDVAKVQWMPRKEFASHWRYSGGWAFAFVYSPLPPLEANE